jgi:dihydrodipicolinate synthase/N-acetylneuraminate lyase
MNPSLRGIFVPFVVPLDANGRINEVELRSYLEWLIERGVHGFYPNGSTGEFTRFTADERKEIVKIACEVAGERVPVLAGTSEANVKETLKACETHAEFGARAVAIVSPFYYKLGPEAVYAYYREIARNSPINVVLYNIPMFASPIDVATIRRLSEFERIVGIKDSSGDISFMQRMILEVQPRRPDFAFFTGWESALTPMLFVGATGATLATAAVVPEVVKKIFDSMVDDRPNVAKKLQSRLIRLFDTMLSAGEFPAGFRAGVAARGFDVGSSRQPACGVRPEEELSIVQRIDEALAALTDVDVASEAALNRSRS